MITSILGILMILGLYIYHYNHQVQIANDSSNLFEYKMKYNNISKIDQKISKQKFHYSQNCNNEILSIIILDNKVAKLKEYKEVNKDVLNITIPQNKNFIISLPTNGTTAFLWKIKNDSNYKIVRYFKNTKMHLPTPINDIGKTGISYDRQNFYFKSINRGIQKLVMRFDNGNKKTRS